MNPRKLLRRAANRARLSPNPRLRELFALVRTTYRLIGRWFPFLHLGWMSNLRRAVWDGDDLVLQGWAFVRGADQGARPEFEVWLHRRFRRERIRATVTPVEDPDVLGAVPRAELNYSNMAFEARLDGQSLTGLTSGGSWQVRVGVTGGGRRTWGPLRRIYHFGSPEIVRLRPFGEGRLVGPHFHERRGVLIVAQEPDVLVRDVTLDNRQISLRVDADTNIEAAVLIGEGQEDVPLTVTREADGVRLVGSLPPGQIVVDEETGARHPPTWAASIGSGRSRRSLTLLDDADGHRPASTSTLLVRGSAARELQIIDVPHFVEVNDIERVDEEIPHLRITGTVVGDPTVFSLVMSSQHLDLPVTLDRVDDGGRFAARVPLRFSMWGGPALPPMRGAYDLEGRIDGEQFNTFVSPALIDRLPHVDSRPDTRLRLELARRDELRVRVTRPRDKSEYGSYHQNILFDRFAESGLPAIDAVYFESFFGRNATCNPRAMDREVARRHPDLPRYWSVDDFSIEVPEGATPLIIGSQEWWKVRESARWIVTNEWLRTRFVKRSFQTVLQTWHGSMYKKIGFDRSKKGSGHLQKVRLERSNWDMFISQNADTTPIIRRAYDFPEGVIESGYPRNDELHDPDPARIAEIRATLGIPEGNTVVMYAPTWREAGQEVELLDVVEMSDRLGTGFTFLQRGHVRTLDLGAVIRHDDVIDVSTHPQINDLYLAADLLITDYSSMMFDYSVTRRPMIFFTPDIDEYTDPKVRGVYFDLEEISAGPVVRTSGEVVELLDSVRSWAPTYKERYDAWCARFNHADDGHAASRAVDALFAFDPKSRSRTLVERWDLEAGTGEDA
ncbi:CDP-glycerol glycerophosphotransferase family protein [Aeromicrobium sp.]|uniref:CDP-glycerol glycerophosphotransferase family protein n=1 Tax=Aeromicrobium sp. TaxID=1871063 RepID=UPI003D6B6124